MRIVTWNVQHRRDWQAGWDYLTRVLAPDVALLQECRGPVDFAEQADGGGRLVWQPVGGRRAWGCAVYSKAWPLVDREFADHPGWAQAVDVLLPDGSALTLANLHCPGFGGHYVTHLHKLVSDLTLHLMPAPRRAFRRLVLGGDLNVCLTWESLTGGQTSRNFFERLAAHGLVSAHRRFHDEEEPTWWGSRRGYQLDHLFVSRDLTPALTSCEVHQGKVIPSLSDHRPLVVDVSLDALAPRPSRRPPPAVLLGDRPALPRRPLPASER